MIYKDKIKKRGGIIHKFKQILPPISNLSLYISFENWLPARLGWKIWKAKNPQPNKRLGA
jgi:hypothetical protein